MGRSRSRSPLARRGGSRERERKRRERPREREREMPKRERRRSRSRSPTRRRSRSPRRARSFSASPPRHGAEPILSSPPPVQQSRKVKPKEPETEGMTPDELEMMSVMGFNNFNTTKGKHMDGASNAHAVNISLKRKYRQYMNRKGGFNRPLDFIA